MATSPLKNAERASRMGLLLLVAGCGPEVVLPEPPVIDDSPDEREVVTADDPPPPVMGGTLTVMDEAGVAIVSDPDRDLVQVVDLEDFSLRHTLELPAGSLPWRSVGDDATGLAHVVLRGSGRVLSLDPGDGRVVEEREVCADPRGLTLRSDDGALVVACADGQLRSLPAEGAPAETLVTLGPDLRDVWEHDDGVLSVSRFRSATVLGLVNVEHPRISGPLAWPRSRQPQDRRRPHTAWRTVGLDDGSWLMLHQTATGQALPALDPDLERPPSYYGGNGCSAVVQTALTRFSPDGMVDSSGPLRDAVLPVDLAVSPDGAWAAIALAASPVDLDDRPIVLVQLDDLEEVPSYGDPQCHVPVTRKLPVVTQAVAVAFDAGSQLLVQTREPAGLHRFEPEGEHVDQLELSAVSRFDTGHELFHEDPGTGITCASCHPEGTDDGHVWNFEDLGPRHTPTLDVGLEGTAPFHWTGELEDFSALVDEVLVRRMGARPPTDERKAALERWMYGLPRPRAVALGEAAERGEALWSSFDCGSCHAGEGLVGNESAAIGTGEPMQIPSLRGVRLHPPYMHDGRSVTLEEATAEMITATAEGRPTPSPEDVADLVAYLRTL